VDAACVENLLPIELANGMQTVATVDVDACPADRDDEPARDRSRRTSACADDDCRMIGFVFFDVPAGICRSLLSAGPPARSRSLSRAALVLQGWSCNVDGSKLPLGPNVEFKLIEYGVAEFDETLARAAGGYEADETLAAIHSEFEQRKHELIDASVSI